MFGGKSVGSVATACLELPIDALESLTDGPQVKIQMLRILAGRLVQANARVDLLRGA